MTVNDCRITNNSAYKGGGIDNYYLGTITGSSISDNSAGAGGGILNNSILKATDCTIEDNSLSPTSPPRDGGGVAQTGNPSTISMDFTDCTIAGNSAGVGGGICVLGGALTLTGCRVTDDLADAMGSQGTCGGGIAAFSASIAITNCTIDGNSASKGTGGGISVVAGSLTITNSTIANNSSSTPGAGGGLANGAMEAILNNTIVALNTDPDGPDDIAGNPVSPASADNLVGADKNCSLKAANHNQLNITDPGLGTLANNGGPTETMALLPGSPASETVTPRTPAPTRTARPRTARPDIGAFQSQGFNVTADITDPTYSAGQVGLTVSAVDGQAATRPPASSTISTGVTAPLRIPTSRPSQPPPATALACRSATPMPARVFTRCR